MPTGRSFSTTYKENEFTMFRKVRILALLTVATSLVTVQTATAQTSGDQTFTVIVPTSISITPPNNAVELTHDLSDSTQAFPPQTWLVRGNVGAGVTVTFTAETPFIHATDPNSKRDLQLGVAVGSKQGSANWTVGTATDATNYSGGTNNATVTVSSNGAGRASLNLSVGFITEEFGTFTNGNYVSTITGTVAAN